MVLIKIFSFYQVKGQVVFNEDSEIYVEFGVEFQFDLQVMMVICGEVYFWGFKQVIKIGLVVDVE